MFQGQLIESVCTSVRLLQQGPFPPLFLYNEVHIQSHLTLYTDETKLWRNQAKTKVSIDINTMKIKGLTQQSIDEC